MNRNFLRAAAYWGIPPLIALIIYRPALDAWFQQDDFVWLDLGSTIHSWNDLWYALFHPTVHGTWRPLGERVYFVVLCSLFGASNAVPFRIVAFLGQFADMALVSAITCKMTRSRMAGFLAPIVWMSSDKLVLTMVWSSNINYIACGFFVLLALWFLLRHIETNRGRDLAAMWVAFLLGLGALEMTVVFPVMAAVYTLTCARPYFKKTLPLFGASAWFAVLHFVFAPNRAGNLYTMYFGPAIFSTLKRYWKEALQPEDFTLLTGLPHAVGSTGVVLFTVALLGYAGYQAVRRNFVPLVFLSWFAILLLPVLPLREHFSTYYLGLPLIGLAMLAADGVATAWRAGPAWRVAAVALLGYFLLESPFVAWKATKLWALGSWEIHSMVTGVAEAHDVHPTSDILLKDVDDALFWGAIFDRCFLVLGLKNVYLAPGSDLQITPHPEMGDVASFIMPDALLRRARSQGRLAVYVWNPKQRSLEDITENYVPSEPAPGAKASVSAVEGARVDVGDRDNADRLSDQWYAIDQGFRWIGKRASVRVNAGTGSRKLHISGYCPAAAVKNGAVNMTVSVDGVSFPAVTLRKGDVPFELEFPLQLDKPKEVVVTVELDHTFRFPPDVRDLGVTFGTFEIQ